ncbi:AAA-ATPase ASD, mitochondrial [Sesamum angolense]|uniref:AAA-ATPase ASD, mitochondrial n=1 Tax=Sesamum angolense TaxID=2727404 RepID=A0AAE2BQR0_9LAMI|nr:AAA-ATPase ASD, mitochondrial [Sesamum angolense]
MEVVSIRGRSFSGSGTILPEEVLSPLFVDSIGLLLKLISELGDACLPNSEETPGGVLLGLTWSNVVADTWTDKMPCRIVGCHVCEPFGPNVLLGFDHGTSRGYPVLSELLPLRTLWSHQTLHPEIHHFLYPYIQITFNEYHGDGFERSKAYAAIERYLNANSTKQAKRLQANVVRDSESIVLSMADDEEVTDEYKGIKLWWASSQTISNQQSISFFPREDEKRYFMVTFHRRYRDMITNNYLKHVLDEGKAITVRERRRKLYTNNKSESWNMWSHVIFEHPASFDTLAMDPRKKQEIVDDLINFSKSKDYYAKIGKPWKRGYLLYGPPGTGKSTMIAAMANLLKYDVYDLELTAVKDNTELRKLLIDTASKSIIVIEDIDCSLDLTGQRERKRRTEERE